MQLSLRQLQVTLLAEDLGQDEIAGRIGDVQTAGPLDAAQTFGQLAAVEEQLAQGMPAPVVGILGAQGGHQLDLGASQIAQLFHGDGQEAQGAGVPGTEAEGFQQPGLGVRRLVEVQLHQPSQLEGLGVLAVEGQGLTKRVLGTLGVLKEQAEVAQVAEMASLGGMLIAEGLQLTQQLWSFFVAIMVVEAEQALEPGIRVGAILRQQLVQDLPGLLVAGAAVKGAGQAEAVIERGRGGALEGRQSGVEQLEPRACHGMPREVVQGSTWERWK